MSLLKPAVGVGVPAASTLVASRGLSAQQQVFLASSLQGEELQLHAQVRGTARTALGSAAAALVAAAATGFAGRASCRSAERHRRSHRAVVLARHAAAAAVEEAAEEEESDDEDYFPEEPEPFDPAKQIGALPPLGYFDPLRLCKVGDDDNFRKYRFCEIKHGRVAMMASVGLVGQHYIQFPYFEDLRGDIPGQIDALFDEPIVYVTSILLIVFFIIELAILADDESKEPGDFGDPFGIGMYDQEMRNKEINNGRFAMFATVGIVAAELNTGKDAIEQLGL